MTRNGKIARLPLGIREQLNRRLADGERGDRLVAWLNTLPKVRRLLARDFAGREITAGNVSEWKRGGYAEWQTQQAAMGCAHSFAGQGRALKAAAQGPLADHLAMVVSVHYAQLLAGWNGVADAAFQETVKALQLVCKNIVELRRGDHRAWQLQVEQDSVAYVKKTTGMRAMQTLVPEVKNYPAAAKLFQEAFAVYRRERQERYWARNPKGGKPVLPIQSNPGQSDPIRPNPTTLGGGGTSVRPPSQMTNDE
jgi:hypothetical protein